MGKCTCLNKLLIKLFVIFISGFNFCFAQAEVTVNNVDSSKSTSRYIDYSDQLLIKIGTVAKSNKLDIVNSNDNQVLKLAPTGKTSLGFGFNYKWLGVGIAFGLPASSTQTEKFGKTTKFDFQLNIYSKKFVIDAFLQQYNGFHIENPATFTTAWDSIHYPIRDSMQTATLGLSGYYVFNNKKLSYKAAYVRNVVQTKSAGSFLLGGYYNIDYAGFKDGATTFFVGDSLPQAVRDSFPLGAFNSKSFGISFGYTYTWVISKHFFANGSLIPGIGTTNLTVYRSNGEKVTKNKGGSSRLIGRLSIGYEGKYFLMGITAYSTTGTITFENFKFQPSTTNGRFFIAKRFNLHKKKLKKH